MLGNEWKCGLLTYSETQDVSAEIHIFDIYISSPRKGVIPMAGVR